MPFWSWTGTATQTNAGGGIVVIDVTAGAGNVVRILYARAVGTFTAADQEAFELADEDNVRIVAFGITAAGSGTQNLTFPRASTDMDSTTDTTVTTGIGTPVKIAGPNVKFDVNTSALAVNDTVQLLLWAWVKNQAGTISVARSTGTVATISPTVNEVY